MFTPKASLHSYYRLIERRIDKTCQREGLTMQSIKHLTTTAKNELNAIQTPAATRDSGRVRIGGGAICF